MEKKMPVLTERENLLMRGLVEGTKSERETAEWKLRRFQRKKEDKATVDAIDKLIPRAVEYADTMVGEVPHNGGLELKLKWSKVYQHEMDRLCEKAGLRGRCSSWLIRQSSSAI